jgi:hypothetical protein
VASVGAEQGYREHPSIVSPTYGQLAEAVALSLRVSRRKNPSIVTVLAPYHAAGWRPVIAEHAAERGVVLRVEPTPYITDLLLTGSAGACSSSVGVESDARWAWVRRATGCGGGNDMLEFLLIGGTRLHVAGVIDVHADGVDGPDESGGQGRTFTYGRRTPAGWSVATRGGSVVRIDAPVGQVTTGVTDGILPGVAMS